MAVFTFEGEHDYSFLHLTTFKARFFTFEVEILFTFVVEEISTIEGGFYKCG